MRFPSLDNERGLDRKQLQEYFDILCELHDETDPAHGPVSLEEKGLKAARALGLAQFLFTELAGWAVNHTIGRLAHPELKASDNTHAYELVGRQAIGDEALEAAEKAREIIASLALYFSLPANLNLALREGLQALNLGEVQSLLAAKTGFRKNTYSLASWRLYAVRRAAFLAVSSKSWAAEERVSAAFGISADTLRSWRKVLLPKVLGANRVKEQVELAREAGELDIILRDDPEYAEAAKGRTETIPWAVLDAQRMLTLQPLSTMGAAYQATLRELGESDEVEK